MPETANFYYGGQAVIEGVMMRGRKHAAIAVRKPDGGIALRREELRGLYTGRVRDIPFLRGIIILAETMTLGSRALIFSSNVALGKDEKDVSTRSMVLMLLTSLAFVSVIFFAGPVFISSWLDRFFDNPFVEVFLEGIIRLLMLLAYLVFIGFMPDVRRVFAYHGAEHMTIHAYEHGLPIVPANVRLFPTAHTRCGTSFLLVVMIVAILVFTALGTPPLIWRVLSRIALLPVIAAVSYEVIRLGARYSRVALVRGLFKPNLWLQWFTTRQPDDSMIEVAIESFRQVVEAEGMMIAADGTIIRRERSPEPTPPLEETAPDLV